LQNLIHITQRLFSRTLSSDENSRALQISGFIRFGLILLQGIILVKAGFDPVFIAIVESFFFLYNLSRYYFLSGGKYAGFSTLKNKSDAFSTIFWGFNVIGLIAVVISLMIMNWSGGEFSNILDLPYVSMAFPTLVFLSLPVDSYDLFYISQNKPNRLITYTIVSSIIQLAIVVGLLVGGFHMGQVVLGLTIFFMLRYLHLILISKPFSGVAISGSWKFVIYASPLILHSLLAGLTDYVDGWLIKAYFDDAAFAIYRFGARELPLNAILIGSVVSGLILHKNAIGDSLKIEMRKILKLLTPILALAILISPWLFQAAYSEDYKLSALYFNLYALLMISHAVFAQVYIYRADDRWLLTVISLAEVICNIGLSIVLMQSLGILGIPIATLIVDFVFRCIIMLIVRVKYDISPSTYYPIKSHLGSSMILMTCFAISYFMFFNT